MLFFIMIVAALTIVLLVIKFKQEKNHLRKLEQADDVSINSLSEYMTKKNGSEYGKLHDRRH